MMALSVQIEASAGRTWNLRRRPGREAEQPGFAGLFRSDHFTVPDPVNPDPLELAVSPAGGHES